jgi:ubiquinone/menaquinone biosynthesis C-methylase UbiE
MDKAEFDKFADEYHATLAANIGISGEGPEYFTEYKIKDISTEYLTRACPVPGDLALLDFGAGTGASVPFIRKYLPQARLTCVDVSKRSLQIGHGRFPNEARFILCNGSEIPAANASFDIAFAACVFHHIDHSEHVNLLQEFRRVLSPRGVAFVFEHNPYNPLTVRAVNTCPFDENARLIHARQMQQRFIEAGFAHARIRYRIFFPRVLRVLRPLENMLTWLPLGAQYYVMGSNDRL